MKQLPRLRTTLLIFAALIVSAILSTAARAEGISYSLSFCENLDILKDPTNTSLISHLSGQSQHSLMMQRTSPFFELRNTSDQAMITQISLSIGKTSSNFDWAKVIESSPGVNYNIESVDSVMGGLNSDMLTISFTGLAPGDSIIFRAGLGYDDPNGGYLQDFRTTMFNLNGNDASGNSVVSVDFQSQNQTETLTGQLPNYSMGGLTTATNMSFPAGTCWDHIKPFSFDGSGTIEPEPGPPVPEPGSFVLLGCGLLGLVALRRRLRRPLP